MDTGGTQLYRPGDEIVCQAMNHPDFAKIISAAFDIQQMRMHISSAESAGIEQQRLEALAKLTHDYTAKTSIRAEDPHLDIVMEAFQNALLNHKADTLTRLEDDRLVTHFMQQIGAYTPAHESSLQHMTPSDLGGMQMHPELQDAVLKMYHEPLPGMGAPYDPLGNARPKTRNEKKALPAHATMFLKQWWHDHYAWPYPTDTEKDMLSAQTGLHLQQVNNWFINQRKRSWHKYFPEGTPRSQQEAECIMRERSRSHSHGQF